MKTYLIHIQLQNKTTAELREFVMLIDSVFNLHTTARHIAYSTPDKTTLGYLVKSDKTAAMLRRAIDGNNAGPIDRFAKRPINTGFKNGDKILVLEVGSDSSDNGFNVATTWLNRHHD